MAVAVGNAPVSYGAFEVTVGVYPNVPGADELLGAIAAAGYAGTELGPPGYLGEGDELRARLDRHGLELTGGWCPIRFSRPEHWDEDLAALEGTLSLFEAAGARRARPVFGDGGSRLRKANPGRGGADHSLGLDAAGWRRWAEGMRRAENLAASRGFEPILHPHAATYVEASWEIERALELTDLALLVDTGHLLLGGTDPVTALRAWGERVSYVHVKDVRMDVLRAVVKDRADMVEAWRRGIFCGLGEGDVDLPRFFETLGDLAYDGWIVVEHDRIPRPDETVAEASGAQVRNRAWLADRVGI